MREGRHRIEPIGKDLSYYTRASDASPAVKTALRGSVDETIIGQGPHHPWPPPRGTRGDFGGWLDLTRREISYPVWGYHAGHRFNGPIALQNAWAAANMGSAFASLETSGLMNTFGATAISRVLPTNPNSSLSTALGELKKDGLPSIPGSSMRDQTDLARKAGNEFLNVEFGWLPLVSDVRKFADSVKRSRSIIDQYKRDSDRKIRRRYVAPPIETTTVLYGTAQGSGTLFYPRSTYTRVVSERLWFSGAFRYHVPVGDDFYSRLRRYESYSHRLFDTRLTPELLWNLAPWSWAVDWFTNTGDVLHNISTLGADGLVMQYGYVMRHAYIDEVVNGIYSGTLDGKPVSGYGAKRILSEVKQRRGANPYGFGVTFSSLSAIQMAVLAALGLTRGQRGDN